MTTSIKWTEQAKAASKVTDPEMRKNAMVELFKAIQPKFQESDRSSFKELREKIRVLKDVPYEVRGTLLSELTNMERGFHKKVETVSSETIFGSNSSSAEPFNGVLPSKPEESAVISASASKADVSVHRLDNYSSNTQFSDLPNEILDLIDQTVSGTRTEHLASDGIEKEREVPRMRVLTLPPRIVLTAGQKVIRTLGIVFLGIWRLYQNHRFEKALLSGDLAAAKLAILHGSSDVVSEKTLKRILKQPNYMPQLELLCAQRGDDASFFGINRDSLDSFLNVIPISQSLEMLDLYFSNSRFVSGKYKESPETITIVWENLTAWRMLLDEPGQLAGNANFKRLILQRNYLPSGEDNWTSQSLGNSIHELFKKHGIDEKEIKMMSDRKQEEAARLSRIDNGIGGDE
jgi:hypothetical protein